MLLRLNSRLVSRRAVRRHGHIHAIGVDNDCMRSRIAHTRERQRNATNPPKRHFICVLRLGYRSIYVINEEWRYTLFYTSQKVETIIYCALKCSQLFLRVSNETIFSFEVIRCHGLQQECQCKRNGVTANLVRARNVVIGRLMGFNYNCSIAIVYCILCIYYQKERVRERNNLETKCCKT